MAEAYLRLGHTNNNVKKGNIDKMFDKVLEKQYTLNNLRTFKTLIYRRIKMIFSSLQSILDAFFMIIVPAILATIAIPNAKFSIVQIHIYVFFLVFYAVFSCG